MRIIARLPPQTAEQVEYLAAATGGTVSHIVREAIAVYHAQVRGARKGGSRLVAMAGAGDSGHTDTATNYKTLYAQHLDQKYPRTPSPAREPAQAYRRAPKPKTTPGA